MYRTRSMVVGCLFNRMLLAWVGLLGLLLAGQARAGETTEAQTQAQTLAVLRSPALSEAGGLFTEVLEQTLGDSDGLALVDRQSIDRVLQEIELSKLAGAEHSQQRLRAGRLLDADLLVLVQPAPDPGEGLMVRLIETHRGLTLSMERFALGDSPDEQAQAIAKLLIDRSGQDLSGVRAVGAVPTFVDRRLAYADAGLAQRMAITAEYQARSVDHLLVVTVDQAQALQREVTLRGEKGLGELGQPLMLEGEISGDPSTPKVLSVSLRIRRGDAVVGERTVEGVEPAAGMKFCARASAELWADALAQPAQPVRFDAMAQGLIDRGEELAKANMYLRAVPLYETAILHRPDDVLSHVALVLLYAHTTRALARDQAIPVPERRRRCVDLYQRESDQAMWVAEHAVFNPLKDVDPKLRQRLQFHGQCYNRPPEELTSPQFRRQVPKKLVVDARGHWRDKIVPQQVYKIDQDRRDWALRRAHELADQGRLDKCSANAIYKLTLGVYLQTKEQDLRWRYDLARLFYDALGIESVTRLFPSHYRGTKEKWAWYGKQYLALSEQGPPGLSYVILGAAGRNLAWGRPDPVATPNHRRIPKPAPPTKPTEPDTQPEPPTKPASDRLRLEPITLSPTAGPGKGQHMSKVFGWRSWPGLGDLVWSIHDVALVSEPGEMRSLVYVSEKQLLGWSDNDQRALLGEPVYDGRYVWVPLVLGEPRLFIVDPKTGRTWRFDGDDGLAGMDRGACVAPLGPGRGLITGSTRGGAGQGSSPKSWSAIVRFDPDTGLDIDVFRQAISSSSSTDGTGKHGRATGLARMLQDPENPDHTLVLVDQSDSYFNREDYEVRANGGYKLVIDPADRTFYELDGFSTPNRDMSLYDAVFGDGRVYYRNFGGREVYSWDGRSQRHEWHFDERMSHIRNSTMYRDRQVFLTEDSRLLGTPWPGGPMGMVARDNKGEDGQAVGHTWFWEPTLTRSSVYGLVAYLRRPYGETEAYQVRVDEKVWASISGLEKIPETYKSRWGRYKAFQTRIGLDQAQRLAQMLGGQLPGIRSAEHWAYLQRLSKQVDGSSFWMGLRTDAGGRLTGLDGDPAPYAPPMIPRGGRGPLVLTHAGKLVHGSGQAAVLVAWPKDGGSDEIDGEGSGSDRIKSVAAVPGLRLIALPPGTATLGGLDPKTRHPSDLPPHRVTIPAGLYMSEAEITRGQFRYVTEDISEAECRKHTKTATSSRIGDIEDFLDALRVRTGQNYRLPTEDEWEYACRAGTTTRFASGDSAHSLRRLGWCSYDGVYSAQGGKRVKSLDPNAWGFYDMHGNYSEWTRLVNVPGSFKIDGSLLYTGWNKYYTTRGGAWFDLPEYCRSASRRPGGDLGFGVSFRILLDTRPSAPKAKKP